MLRNLFFLIISLIFTVATLNAAEVKNSNVRQQGNRVLFEFDIEGDAGEDTEVNLSLTIKGKNYSADQLHLEGDFGKTKTGKAKKIYWNVLRDFPRGVSATVDWDLTAGGGKLIKDKTTGMELVLVKGGCYEMGDMFGDGDKDEKPTHEVCVDNFYMGKHEVTVGEFKKFVNDTGYKTEAEKEDGCYYYTGSKWEKDSSKNWRNPGFSQNDKHPVVCVSWNDTQIFANWLSRKEGKKYRLPTEAEWEYAARGGTQTRNYWGDRQDDACRNANVADKTLKRKHSNFTVHDCDDGHTYTAPVGSFKPNAFGLYDMMGNANEWCQDWFDENYYRNSPKDNPQGAGSGTDRVLRGGSWYLNPQFVRASIRNYNAPSGRFGGLGFRLARTP